jgi:protein-disulfide isomerase
MDKRFWGVLGVIILIFVGILWVNGHKANAPSSSNGQPTNHVEGNTASGVTLVEYGDFECPVCYSYFAVVKQVVDERKGDIAFQFRNFPITSAHKNAFAGARAAEAAALQNKYWEMHDTIYQNQDPSGQSGWVVSDSPQTFFNDYAKQLGLNLDQFKKDYASDKANNAINADVAVANKLNVTGTPSFFINDKEVPLSDVFDNDKKLPTVEKFNKVIDDAIAAKKK